MGGIGDEKLNGEGIGMRNNRLKIRTLGMQFDHY